MLTQFTNWKSVLSEPASVFSLLLPGRVVSLKCMAIAAWEFAVCSGCRERTGWLSGLQVPTQMIWDVPNHL